MMGGESEGETLKEIQEQVRAWGHNSKMGSMVKKMDEVMDSLQEIDQLRRQ